MTKVDPVETLTSGKIKKSDIGKTVYLSNSQCATQEWRIADVGHDNTAGTVDLFPKYMILNSTDWNYNSSTPTSYDRSYIRYNLNTIVYNGFNASIKESMQIQLYKNGKSIVADKLKCPSMDELGCHDSTIDSIYTVLSEGSIYPIFGDKQLSINSLASYKRAIDNKTFYYWTRSLWSSTPIFIYGNGQAGYNYPGTLPGAIGCIRFGKDPIAQELSKPDPVEILTSGKITKDYIGFPVTLTNTVAQCQEWVIADINHDDTSGTVDLFPKYLLTVAGSVLGNKNYALSSLRAYINSTLYNGFNSEIKDAMINQEFAVNGIVYSDKIKCPSLDEIGCSIADTGCIADGTIYPIFGDEYLVTNSLAAYRLNYFGDNRSYWTRSYSINSAHGVNKNGRAYPYGYNEEKYIVGIIRFGKK